VAASETKPETVLSQFKAWATRNLGNAYPNRKRFWTEGGSTRWINRDTDLTSAIEYTLEAQDLKGVE